MIHLVGILKMHKWKYADKYARLRTKLTPLVWCDKTKTASCAISFPVYFGLLREIGTYDIKKTKTFNDGLILRTILMKLRMLLSVVKINIKN